MELIAGDVEAFHCGFADLDALLVAARRFGRPRKPFYIVLSKDDKALGLSKFIAGGAVRVGDDTNVEELAALGATVIDLTDVKAIDSSNHGKFAQLAAVGPELRAVLGQGIRASSGSSREAAGSTLGAVVALPVTILGAPISILAGQ
jgi:esterase/lipase superfamily enzyme